MCDRPISGVSGRALEVSESRRGLPSLAGGVPVPVVAVAVPVGRDRDGLGEGAVGDALGPADGPAPDFPGLFALAEGTKDGRAVRVGAAPLAAPAKNMGVELEPFKPQPMFPSGLLETAWIR